MGIKSCIDITMKPFKFQSDIQSFLVVFHSIGLKLWIKSGEINEPRASINN